MALPRYVRRLTGSGYYLALFSVLAVLSGCVCRGDSGFTLWVSVLIPMHLEAQGVSVMQVLLAVALT